MSMLHRAFRLASTIHSDALTCLEFGVFRGDSFLWQVRRLARRRKGGRLYGFDSWQGLPDETTGVWFPERHRAGAFRAEKAVVERRLSGIRGRSGLTVELIDGFFSESLTPVLQHQIRRADFVNIDVDLHKSALEVLDFIGPLLRPKSIIYFDDWRDPRDLCSADWGVHLAFDQWQSRNSAQNFETLEVNALNQRYMIVSGSGDDALPAAELRDIRYLAFRLQDGELNFSRAVRHRLKRLVRPVAI